MHRNLENHSSKMQSIQSDNELQSDKETIFGYTSYPPFDPKKPRYSQKEFLGRLLHFCDVIDPSTLFTTEAELNAAVRLLNEFKLATVTDPAVTDEKLWKAKKLTQAIIHPDTGERIWRPFRMSGFVPFGVPMVLGLMWPNPSMFHMVFFHWINQSHNACVNYANRNASQPTPTSKFLQGYLAAVSSAVGIAVGLTAMIKRANRLPPATRLLIQRFVPVPAVSTASMLNALMMRWHERSAGIEVFDSKGKALGSSKVAAKKAVKETAISRFCLPAPIFIVPAVAMTQLEKTKFLKKHPRMHLPLNAFWCTATFALALPASIALFPQISSITRADVEPEIAAMTTEERVFYNKGL